MQSIPLVRSRSVRPLVDYLDGIGVRPGPALERARILLRDPTTLIPFPFAGSLFAEAQRVAGMEEFGLRLGQTTRLLEFGEWGALLRQAVTVGGILRTATTASTRFNTGQRFAVDRVGNQVWFQVRMSPRLAEGRSSVSTFQLMLMIEAIRLAAGPGWRPTEIHLEGSPPRYAAELAGYAAKAIHFGRPCTTLVFPTDVLAIPYPRFAPQLTAAAGAVPSLEFEGACRQVIESLLKLGAAELSAAAEFTRISERSLQRGLAARGLTFKQLVETARFESAVRMLDDPGAKIVEIAAHLGYTDSANFTRAFRRWSGVAPRAFRQRLRNRELAAGG